MGRNVLFQILLAAQNKNARSGLFDLKHGWHCCHKPVFTSYFLTYIGRHDQSKTVSKVPYYSNFNNLNHWDISNNCRCASLICNYLLYRCWTRGLVFELPPWGLHVLPCALPTLSRSSAFPMKEYAHSLCYQQTHSLHLKMLDPHHKYSCSSTISILEGIENKRRLETFKKHLKIQTQKKGELVTR